MKRRRSLFTFVMIAMVLVSMVMPVSVEAATVTKSQTVYATQKKYGNYVDIYVGDLNANSKITDVKSSKKNVAVPKSVTYYGNACEDFEDEKAGESSYYAHIRVRLLKKGTTKISFKVDGKKMSTTLKVLPYTNPVKKADLYGVSNGKNLVLKMAKYTKNESFLTLNNSGTVKSARIELEAKSGWKITEVSSINYGTGETDIIARTKGVKKATLQLGTLLPNKASAILVTFKNTKTKATLECLYLLNY